MTKLFLSGILLLTILTACSDRNEEVYSPADQNVEKKEINVNRKESARVVEDTIKSKTLQENNIQNAAVSPETPEDTIDPTKPDRPK